MPFVTTKDGPEIFYKDWGHGQPSLSIKGGHLARTIGTPKCSSFCSKATA